MKKKILVFLAIFFILALAGGIYYANAFLLPTVVKDKITSALSAATGTRVTLQNVRVHLLRGVVLSELVVYDKEDPSRQLLRIQDSSASLLIIPLFKEKRIIIPGIRIEKASLRLVRHKDNSWNIGALLQKPASAQQEETILPLIKDIILRDTEVTIVDDAAPVPQVFTLRVDNIDARVTLDGIAAEGQGELQSDSKAVPLSFKGDYSFADRKLNTRLAARNLDAKLIADRVGPLPVSLQSGMLSQIRADLSITENTTSITVVADINSLNVANDMITLKDGAAHATINLETAKDNIKNFNTDGSLDILGASVAYKDQATAQVRIEKSTIKFTADKNNLSITGDLSLKDASGAMQGMAASGLNAQVKINLGIPLVQDPVNQKVITYEGSGKITSGALEGIPRVNKITGLNASFAFNNNSITVDSATIGVFNTVVTGSGDFTNKTLNADIRGEFDIADFVPFVPESANLPAYKISGAADMQAHISTPLPLPDGLPLISGEATLKDIWLELTDNPITFTTDKGRLKFDLGQESLEWHDESIVVNNDKTYSCDGTLRGFKTPQITALLIGQDIKINAQFTKTGDILNFASFKGQLKNSRADLKGTVDLDQQTLDVKGSVQANLIDIPLKDAGLRGLCQLDIQCQGPLKNSRRWNLKAKGSSDFVGAYGYKAKNINFLYEQISGIGIIDSLSFEAYGGQGLVKGRFQIGKDVMTYAVRGVIDDLELAALKLDTPMKDKKLYGTLALKIAMQGAGNNTKNLKGGGNFTIKNGYLGEFSGNEDLGTFLFAQTFGKVVFTTAQGDFFIKDGAVSTDNLELLGPVRNLLIDGKVGFDGSLDLLINTQIPLPGPAGKLQGTEMGEAVTRAGGFTAVEVKGTIQNPKKRLLSIQANIMKKAHDVVSSILP